MALEWNPNLDVGVPDLDRQHRALFETIDRLLEAAGEGRGRQEIGEVLGFLERYVGEHFALEERLMVETLYPSYGPHKAEHDAFVADFKRLQAEFLQGGPTTALVLQVNDRVSSWLWRHIARTDKTFGLYLSGRQARRAPPAVPRPPTR